MPRSEVRITSDLSPKRVQPVKSPVSNPGFVMRFALTGWARENAAAVAKAIKSLGEVFMPKLNLRRNPITSLWEPVSSEAGWSWGCVSAIDSNGRTIWIVDAHRDNGKRLEEYEVGTKCSLRGFAPLHFKTARLFEFHLLWSRTGRQKLVRTRVRDLGIT